jgi:hypothetical protein
MFRGNRLIAVAVLATAVSLVWFVPRQYDRKKPGPEDRPKKAQPAWGEDMPMDVEVSIFLEEDTGGNQELLDAAQEIAQRMSGRSDVPGARRQYYADLEHQAYQMRGWDACLEAITPLDGGYRVRLGVGPKLWIPGGPLPMVHSAYVEDYLVTPEDIIFVGADESEHMRGWGYSIVTLN